MSTQLLTEPDEVLFDPNLGQPQLQLTSPTIGDAIKARLQIELDVVLDRIKNPAVNEIARTILDELVLLFQKLSLIEGNLRKLDMLLENLSILEIVQYDVRSLTDFIELRAMKTEGISDRLMEVLDGIRYGISHDVKRIFERELVGTVTDQSTPVVYGKIKLAHGLLTNCLQQSMITLLQVFNPSVDASQLFEDFEDRLRQSLLLCNDLSSLLRLVGQAEEEGSAEALQELVQGANRFRDGSMQYLMYKDWRGYEQLALALITSIESNSDSKDLMHQFGCFLQVLYGQVKMRACLKDMFTSLDQ